MSSHYWIPILTVSILAALGGVVLFKIASTAEREIGDTHSTARSFRRLGYVWIFGILVFLLSGGPESEPAFVTVLGLAMSAFLIWITFRAAKKMEKKTNRQMP